MTFLTSEKHRILNLFSFLIYFLIYITIFTTIGTVVDDSFARWTYKDFIKDISSSFDALPWSLWSIVLALSDIVKEIVSEFGYNILLLAFLPTFISYYCSYRGRKKGKRSEREVWIQWYEKVKNDDGHKDTNTLPFLSGSNLINSHFKRIYDVIIRIGRSPVLLVQHFLYNLNTFGLLILIRSITISLSIDIILLLALILLTTICTIASTYIEANSIINGIESERNVWTKWYFINYGNISQVKHLPELPNSIQGNYYSIITKLKYTIILIYRQPVSITVNLFFWIIISHLIYSLSLGFWISIRPDRIGRLLIEYSICAIIITLIIMNRKAIGRQKGRAIEQEKCVNEYSATFHQVSTNINKKHEYSSFDSYDLFFVSLHESVKLISRKPQILVYHFVGWICTLILIYGFTDWLLLERLDYFVQLLVVVILTFMTSILETQQFIIGIINQRQIWTDWYHRLIEVKNEDLPFTELPPIIN